MSRGAQARRAAGFTLLELLVAITLLGLLMAAMLGGLRLGARVWETGEARLDAATQVQIVQEFLRQRLTEALPLDLPAPEDDRSRLPVFAGDSTTLRFAGSLPEPLGGGLYVMELALSEPEGGSGTGDLVLRWQTLDLGGQGEAPPVAEPEQRVLLSGVAGLELAYFGTIDPRAPPDWWPQWLGQAGFPGLVRLQVNFPPDDLRQWPELVVRPLIDVAPPL